MHENIDPAAGASRDTGGGEHEAERESRVRAEFERLVTTISTGFINLDPDAIDHGIRQAVREIGRSAEVDRSYLYLFSDDQGTMRRVAEWTAEGVEGAADAEGPVPTGPFSSWLARLREAGAFAAPDLDAVPDAALRDHHERAGVRAFVDVSIRGRGVLLGFLGLCSLTGERDWPEATVSQLRLLAEIVANALDRKSMESALRESEAKLREVVEHAPIVLWAIDRDGIFTFSEGSGLRSLGLEPGEVVGRSVFDVYDGNEGIVDDAKRVLAGERVMSLSRVGDLAFEVHLAPLFDEDGRPDGAIGVATDVTERRRLETMLRHSQKMQAVGQLAGGVAHDFNNLLQAIRGYAALGRRLAGGKVRGYLDEILRASDRAGNLVRQLLTFSRREALRPEYLSLSEVVTGLGEMLSRLIGEHLELEILTGADLGIVRADRGQVEQVVVNLCVNARDAMVNGGRLRLETDNVRFGSDDLSALPWAMEGDFVRLSVSDTGCGIPPEVRERVFEPFFTTKETGQGTGLGLATVYAITERHGGFVKLESEVGEGTRVEVHLPRVELPPDVTPARAAVEAAGGGTETILVAEDDEQVAELAEAILTDAGYRVLLARDGEQAVALFAEHAAEIGAAVLDVVMPKLSGRDVSEAILARRPELPILFTSGYRGDILEGLPGPEPAILRKPFAPRALLAKVGELISGSPDA